MKEIYNKIKISTTVAIEKTTPYIGFITRTTFIGIVMWIAYLWMHPQSLGNKPLGQITLNELAGDIFFVFAFIMLFKWLVRNQGNTRKSYMEWAGIVMPILKYLLSWTLVLGTMYLVILFLGLFSHS